MKVLVYLSAFFMLLATLVRANEMPTKLLRATLQPAEDCKKKVSQNTVVKFHYKARVWNSEDTFESTYHGEPVKFKLGRDKIMKGLEAGIKGMCVGEIRRLVIPSDMAFGEQGLPGKVPGDTTVIYEVEMLYVQSPFDNPWFWTGLAALGGVYWMFDRYTKAQDAAKSTKSEGNKSEEVRDEAKLTKGSVSS